MWLLGDPATADPSGGANLYTLLITIAVLLLGSGGFLQWRAQRRRPDVDPEPVARRAASGVEDFLQRRVRQLERERAEDRRQHDRERAELERRLHEEQAKTLALTEVAATMRAERAALMERNQQLRGYVDE